jgi:hypothetical protein
VHRHARDSGDVLFGVVVMTPDSAVTEAMPGHHVRTPIADVAKMGQIAIIALGCNIWFASANTRRNPFGSRRHMVLSYSDQLTAISRWRVWLIAPTRWHGKCCGMTADPMLQQRCPQPARAPLLGAFFQGPPSPLPTPGQRCLSRSLDQETGIETISRSASYELNPLSVRRERRACCQLCSWIPSCARLFCHTSEHPIAAPVIEMPSIPLWMEDEVVLLGTSCLQADRIWGMVHDPR